MEASVYYGVTMLLYALIILISCFTDNVTTVFGFISAFSTSFNVYTVPGLLYVLGERKFGNNSKKDCFRTTMAWFFIVLGLVVFVIELISSII
jgi:hypothetical protein